MARKRLDFEFNYLAHLTRERIKPLSRWEGRFGMREIDALHHLGLKTRIVQRTLQKGQATRELIFSMSSHYLDAYDKKFSLSPLQKDTGTIIEEGFFFGFPSCCAHHFAEFGYSDNRFIGNGQELLFHWVCPDCRITLSLLPYYSKIYRECEDHSHGNQTSVLKHAAGAIVALSLAAMPIRAEEDPHWTANPQLPLSDQYLLKSESYLLGCMHQYTASDSIAGPIKAMAIKTVLDSLPEYSPISSSFPPYPVFVEPYLLRGVISCPICGEMVNMGYMYVVNLRRGLKMQLPYLAVHFLEHGSFFMNDTNRIDVDTLLRILAPLDTAHQIIPVTGDLDSDGLRDDVEDNFDMSPAKADSDGDGVPDGQEVAETIIRQILSLPVADEFVRITPNSPYIQFYDVYGLEKCTICGETFNMGTAKIYNPLKSKEIEFPIIALHYLAHGRFAYSGEVHAGEIDVAELLDILQPADESTVNERHEIQTKSNFGLINYPNPFNSTTQIEFYLDERTYVDLSLFNLNGQRVQTIYSGFCEKGNYRLPWNSETSIAPLSNGVYLLKLKAGERVLTQRMILLK